MGIDRSTVVQVIPEHAVLYVTHQWARAGVETPHRGIPLDRPPHTPLFNDKIRSGEPGVISRLDDFPPEASTDLETFRQAGNKSNVTIPLWVGEVVVGAVLFGAIFFRARSAAPETGRRDLRKWLRTKAHRSGDAGCRRNRARLHRY